MPVIKPDLDIETRAISSFTTIRLYVDGDQFRDSPVLPRLRRTASSYDGREAIAAEARDALTAEDVLLPR